MILSLQSPISPAAAASLCPFLSPLRSTIAAHTLITTCCSGIASESLELKSHQQLKPKNDKQSFTEANRGLDATATGKGGQGGVSGVQVPRSRYICVSKSELLNAITTTMFESEIEADLFVRLSRGLDSILHAEHRSMLEEMRVNYDLTHSAGGTGSSSDGGRQFLAIEKEPDVLFSQSVEFRTKEGYAGDKVGEENPFIGEDLEYQSDPRSDDTGKNSFTLSRVVAETHFQRAFVQLLYNAEFEELSVSDLLLTSALNNDYILTLPISVDWEKASESNTIIYRRGYTTEKQKGLLISEKLDYLQSKLLQRLFFLIAQPLGNVGLWLVKVIGGTGQDDYIQGRAEAFKLWLKKLLPSPHSYSSDVVVPSNRLEIGHILDTDIPIWLAARKAVVRYKSILSAVGPRSQLLRKFFMWIGILSTDAEETIDFEAESFLRPIFLPRISLADIWKPASKENCGNDVWKKLKAAISVLLSKSTLQEPAFAEIVLSYTEPLDERDNEDKAGVPALRLKIYGKIPIPDIAVIFPYKKLSFRILDAVRLDVASILGLLAYFVNYKFEDVLSSPAAIRLDIIALSALVIYVFRVILGYKQTRDRYQFLVNRTLHEKTVASGFGSVHFLLDASQQQLYKEAILAYAILLKAETCQMNCASMRKRCEEFLYHVFNKKIEISDDKAKSTLLRLGLVEEKIVDGEIVLHAIRCSEACEVLKHRWGILLV